MEATLFWIGCGLGVYGFLLRQVFKKQALANKPALLAVLHVLFLVACGALAGFVVSASVDLHGPSPRWPVTFAAVAFAYALIQLSGSNRAAKAASLLAGDLEWAETSFSAILLAAVIMYAVVQAFKIPSGSMEDTLLIGDHLFVNKFIYGIRVPFTDHRVIKIRDVHHQEVVVFEAPGTAILSPEEREHHVRKDFIKRAIGLPGDIVEIKNKHVFVNGQPSNEPYAIYRDPSVWPNALKGWSPQEYQHAWESGEFAKFRREEVGDNFGPIKVPPKSYFVMGDNRDGSFDSRFWGPMPNRLLKGKAWFVYWPPRRAKIIR